MVFIIHPKQFFSSISLIPKANINYKLQSEFEAQQAQEQQPDPIMTSIQEPTKVSELEGGGFVVKGAGSSRDSERQQNNKLRKFVSLKIK